MLILYKSYFSTIVLAILFVCSACTHKDKSEQAQKTERFLDRVSAQADLQAVEISKYVRLDSIDNYTKKTTFTGDTIWYRNEEYSLVIIRYDDHLVCTRKLLLVFDKKGKCTDNMTVETGCDVDGSTDSWQWSFKIFNDTSFSRTETYTQRKGRKDDLITVTEQYYKITRDGKIIPLNKKVHSFTQAKNPEDEDI